MTGASRDMFSASPPKPPSKPRRSPRRPTSHRADAEPAAATEQGPAARLERTATCSRLRRLNLHQTSGETLHIRRLENGLERPCGRSRPASRGLASLVASDAFIGELTRGSIGTIPATVETENTRSYQGVYGWSRAAHPFQNILEQTRVSRR